MIIGGIHRLKNARTRNRLQQFRTDAECKRLQEVLQSMGRKLKADGIIGGITINAIKRVNNARMWELYDKDNTRLMESAPTDEPLWIYYARQEIGVAEIHGKADNPRVLQYLDAAAKGWFKHDETPWCAAFVSFIMTKVGYGKPAQSARAKSWRNWGKRLTKPAMGAIAVKNRKGGGHVTFVVGTLPNGYIACLGGNQGDKVSIQAYRPEHFTDFMYPRTENPDDYVLPALDAPYQVVTKES